MIYKDSKGNLINNIEDWKNYIFKNTKKEKHWKKGRSAFEIANFMMKENGELIISKVVSTLLSENVLFKYAVPELEIRFDQYGHGREHDIGIWGLTESKRKFLLELKPK